MKLSTHPRNATESERDQSLAGEPWKPLNNNDDDGGDQTTEVEPDL